MTGSLYIEFTHTYIYIYMFGTYKTKRNRFRLNGKFLRNVNRTATLAKNVVFA